MIYGANSVDGTTANTTSNTKNSVTDPNEAQDRFLKLLVAQLNNQDPMNPMDNAEMTSQMAQINTVTGIQHVEPDHAVHGRSVHRHADAAGHFHDWSHCADRGQYAGDGADGTHTAAFDLEGSAADVKIQITTASGELVDTITLVLALSGAITSPGMPPTNTAVMPLSCATRCRPPMARLPWPLRLWRHTLWLPPVRPTVR
ncbi:hypothetical protein J4711_15015 [Staphylococcus epidermidis]|nr:hypothetical protein [Staphylococcus epidermidis]